MDKTQTSEASPKLTDECKIWKQVQSSYELKEIIGKGVYGTVMRAKNLKTGQDVAIKLI